MQLYTDIVQDQYGNAVSGASVLISLSGSPATIYSDNGVTPKANPLTTDSKGEFSFYAAGGTYTVAVTTSAGTVAAPSVTLFDPADLSAATGAGLVGFDAGETYASGTVGAKLKERSSGADHGADGDGLDVVTTLQSALTNAKNTNPYGDFRRTINLNAGYFLLSAGVTVPHGTGLQGEGVESTNLNAAGYALATGLPMLTYTSAADWRIAGIRMQGGDKASGILFTNGYFGVADQMHFNAMTPYGVKLSEAAQSTFRSCSFYYYPNATDVAVLLNGGSMTALMNCNFDTRSIGVKSGPDAGSGVRVQGCSFGSQYPALKIGNGDSLWDIQGDYFEGSAGQPAMDVIDVGSFNGGGGAAKTNVNFNSNQVAGALVNDITFYQAGTLNFHGNEIGVNVTVGADVSWLHASGNTFAAGKTLTDNAAFSTVDAPNDRRMSSAFGTRKDQIDGAGLGVMVSAFNRALTNWVQKTADALNFEWRLSGSTTNKLSLTSAGILQAPAAIRPGALGAAPAQQTATGIYAGTGAPNNSYGADGDFYFRSDGTVAGNTVQYHKEGGSWVAFTTA